MGGGGGAGFGSARCKCMCGTGRSVVSCPRACTRAFRGRLEIQTAYRVQDVHAALTHVLCLFINDSCETCLRYTKLWSPRDFFFHAGVDTQYYRVSRTCSTGWVQPEGGCGFSAGGVQSTRWSTRQMELFRSIGIGQMIKLFKGIKKFNNITAADLDALIWQCWGDCFSKPVHSE